MLRAASGQLVQGTVPTAPVDRAEEQREGVVLVHQHGQAKVDGTAEVARCWRRR